MQKEADMIFSQWKKLIKEEYGVLRFLKKERAELLEALLGDFYQYGVSAGEAKIYANHVKQFLVTREGSKGKGNHKGWIRNVEEDYLAILAEIYDSKFEKKDPESKLVEANPTDQCEIITTWAKDKFQSLWSEELNEECHVVNSPLNIMYQEEVLYNKNVDSFILEAVKRKNQ